MSVAMRGRLPAVNVAVLMLLLWLAATMSWWGLAFAPPAGALAPWVGRLQSVCFGTAGNGLPAPYGWGALIAGPLAMLGLLWAVWTRELLGGLRALARSVPGLLTLLLVAGALAAEAGWVAWRLAQGLQARAPSVVAESPALLPASYARMAQPAPPFDLLDQHGQRIGPAHFRGRPVILSFGFGHCSTVCPLLLRTVARGAEGLADADPAVLVITLDPWRDTPSSLVSLWSRWGLPERAHVLSGDIDAVNRALDGYNVARRRDPRTGDIEHLALVYVLDRQGRIAYALNNPPAGWIVEAVRRAGG